MDLRNITALLPRHADNAIFTVEHGKAVRRGFDVLHADVLAARQRLHALGIEPGMRVGIRAQNGYDWVVHDLALIELRAVSVAFTADFAETGSDELCARYDLALLLTGADPRKPGSAASAVAAFGDEHPRARARADLLRPSDPDYDRPGLIFSSGSAGGVKGMILNRRGIEACVDAFTQAVAPRADDRLLVFLPLSNFQQRLMVYAALWYGFDLVVVEPVHLFRALQELPPTILIAPPAFYETFETRFDNLPEPKRRLARRLGRALGAVPIPALRKRLARAVFGQAYQALGGNIRFMVTGMAPIKRSTLELFALMQLPLFETYGLIESGSVALNLPAAHRIGSVGKPLPGVRVTLAPDNEILVAREHPISVGYFESAPGESERVFVDGAVATGDIGRYDADGYLYLVGRKKEMIVTSGGEKIHPEALEAEINRCPDVERAVVIGRDGAPGVAAVVRAKQPGDAAAELRISDFIDALNARLRNVQIAPVVFTEIGFSRDNGLLRPNLKLDRGRIAAFFAEAIDGPALPEQSPQRRAAQ